MCYVCASALREGKGKGSCLQETSDGKQEAQSIHSFSDPENGLSPHSPLGNHDVKAGKLLQSEGVKVLCG